MSRAPAQMQYAGHGAAVLERDDHRVVRAPHPRRAPLSMRYMPVERIAEAHHLVPQAILSRPVEDIARRVGTYVQKGTDDFDTYKWVGLMYANIPFTIMHYQGHPEDTATIYMPQEIKDLRLITLFVENVIRYLKLDESDLFWQRKDDPGL